MSDNTQSSVLKRIRAFIKEFDDLEVELKRVNTERSQVDTDISEWYHKVEGTKITHVSQSHKLIKQIQPLLDKRRDLKIEWATLQSVCDSLRVTIAKLKTTHTKQLTKHEDVKQEIKDRAK